MACNVAIFGATCSPAQSQYVKNLNATENEREFPKAAAAIKEKHYVDDYLDSVDTEEEAVKLALEVAEVHRKAGFRIRNWVSNRPSVLEAIGEVRPAEVKDLTMNSHSGLERVLGLSWLTTEDVFCFKFNLQDDLKSLVKGNIVPTKRMMLSFVMKIYDPLGLVGSLVIQGKILLQDKHWLQVLKELDNIRIPRCYFPGYDPACYEDLELHIFVDGSEQAYSATAYFRVRDQGQIRCTLVSSKTKVAPLQQTSIPRLELQAAVIGARLRKTIEDGHLVQVKRTNFWSDSSTVISWIKSDTRRYRQYVAFRANEILSLSKTDERRWLGTKINIADESTKWGKGPNCKPDSRWMRGPAFLYQENKDWPADKFTIANETEEELRPAYVCSHFLAVSLIDVSRFSKYERLLRSMAYVHRFAGKLLQRIGRRPRSVEIDISREDLQNAEECLWRIAQSDGYADEVATMNRNVRLAPENRKALSRSSSMARLPPMLDDRGLLRVDGRISAADCVQYDTKFPIVLPKCHPITNLLLSWYHRKFRHGNNETVANEIRQKFSIPSLRARIRSLEKSCQWCRVCKATPAIPKMTPVPWFHTTPFVRPFTFVGIDYFGPYLVKIGRSSVKRWVAIFTCLTVRAIHLEVVHSLTTDSCKKAVRRFIARRGAPKEVYTDNDTNFIGASRELDEELRKINLAMGSAFTDTDTQWRFNPPSAPHMGGCWERMVRSVKTALGVLPTSRKLNDESFTTFLAEAEHMVNSRPLIYLPLDSAQQEALTPNHFLMLSSSGVRQLVKPPTDEKEALKNSWKLIQERLDSFWRRWITEYLPILTRQCKWFHDVPPIKEGALVMIVDGKVRNLWTRGRISRIYPGKDGVARRADVETATGMLKGRAVCNLAVLDVTDHERASCGGQNSGELGATRHEGEDITVDRNEK
ncbi:uncharacterized protein LOC129720125 [Wyeomyia smithii]|uniref:uncharacterized protein LOC129720125 n=1 Tax=Wyeomyia smithii TaxID=174621 RepID=UPI002467CDE3|nr:uncharacterized protein LOC129720125 [Wyeomyia smithii]